MTFPLPAAAASPAELVGYLADPHRRVLASRLLMELGAGARDAALAGLAHRDPRVRAECCRILDHVMDTASVPALAGVLTDTDAEVRMQALHALACDRCKDGSCRPAPALFLAQALSVLREDPSPRVRAFAVELVASCADGHPAAAAALAAAAADDSSPAVRKKARWYLPGGPVYRRAHRPQAGRHA
jgi:HEAT repeat protein